ncbi:MAG TPA: VOC family protein [Ktedonobacterales bacterium]|nr:VOC family protein [Ktedonobacterales bacterium]
MEIDRLDHLVLTVRDIEATIAFYTRVLGMEEVTFGEGSKRRKALRFGRQKINLHEVGHEFAPHADAPTPGSADLCLLTHIPIEDVMTHITTCGVQIELGLVPRLGARGPIVSIYMRDPDGNLIEIANEALQ